MTEIQNGKTGEPGAGFSFAIQKDNLQDIAKKHGLKRLQ